MHIVLLVLITKQTGPNTQTKSLMLTTKILHNYVLNIPTYDPNNQLI